MKRLLALLSYQVLLLLNLLATILLVVSYVASWVSPLYLSFPAIIALGYPFYFFINLFWVFFWFYRKNRAIYLSLAALTPSLFYFPFVFALGSQSIEDRVGALKITAWNMHYFNNTIAEEAEWVNIQDQMFEFIQENQAQIFCAQEFSGKKSFISKRADEKMKEMGYQYRYKGGGSSLAIYSKFKIIKGGLLDFEGSYNGAIYADIAYLHHKIRVYNVHLQSNKLGNDVDEVFKKENLENINSKTTQEKYFKIENKLSNAFQMRAIQAIHLSEHIKNSPYPVIICGDFNDTPISYTYRKMIAGRNDVFVQCGRWLGITYAGPLPALRIDYILTDKKMKSIGFEKQQKAISDHYAISAWLGF